MVVVGIHEAKTQLSKLLKRVEDGEEVVIERRGVPVARLVAISAERSFAAARNRYAAEDLLIADDFDALPAEIAEAFGAA
jgi:prevent-host-death family protein